MKRRDEENLINLAFGEFSDGAVLSEASLNGDAKASARLAQYQRLKDDLSLLNDIPEPQISKERIREAILRRGLKDRRFRLSWAFALVPVVVAAIGLGIVLKQQAPSVSSVVAPVAKGVASLPDMAHFAAPAQTQVFQNVTELANPERAARTDYSFGDARPLSSRQSSRHYRSYFRSGSPLGPLTKDAMAMDPNSSPEAMLEELNREAASAQLSSPPTGATAPGQLPAVPAPSGDDSKIIVVHDAQDQSTGTQQATEVDRTANVLVGG